MSGYLGNPDAESEHALILSENGVEAARQAIAGGIRKTCIDCNEKIQEQRLLGAAKYGMKCIRCIDCQSVFERNPAPRIKMLDRIL